MSPQQADDFQVLRHHTGPAVHQQHHDIGFGNRQFRLMFDQGHHAFRRGRFQPSGIDKPKRPVPVIGLRIVPISCDARHVVDDRRFLPNAVEQGRFTNIRPADDGNGGQRGRELDRERRWWGGHKMSIETVGWDRNIAFLKHNPPRVPLAASIYSA